MNDRPLWIVLIVCMVLLPVLNLIVGIQIFRQLRVIARRLLK